MNTRRRRVREQAEGRPPSDSASCPRRTDVVVRPIAPPTYRPRLTRISQEYDRWSSKWVAQSDTLGGACVGETPRRRMVGCVIERGWNIVATATRFQIDAKTVRKWWDRFVAEGEQGLEDRSSRSRRSPNRTPRHLRVEVLRLRRKRRWGADHIAFEVGLAASTVQGILNAAGVGRLDRGDRATDTKPIGRYQRDTGGSSCPASTNRTTGSSPPNKSPDSPKRCRTHSTKLSSTCSATAGSAGVRQPHSAVVVWIRYAARSRSPKRQPRSPGGSCSEPPRRIRHAPCTFPPSSPRCSPRISG